MNSYLFDRPHPFGMLYDPNYMFYLHSLMLAQEQQRIYANLHLFPQNPFFSREISKIQGQMALHSHKQYHQSLLQREKQIKMMKKIKNNSENAGLEMATYKSPSIQKENRNVISNLLRVLMKNLLELHLYDQFIENVIREHKLELTLDQFFAWLARFKINFKNYIKPKEMYKITSAKHCKQYQNVFRVVVKHYANQMGVLHCLSSKRIDGKSRKRHIEGLRELFLICLGKNL